MLREAIGGLGGEAHSSIARDSRALGGVGFLGGLGNSRQTTGADGKNPGGIWMRKPMSCRAGWSQLITQEEIVSADPCSQQQHDASAVTGSQQQEAWARAGEAKSTMARASRKPRRYARVLITCCLPSNPFGETCNLDSEIEVPAKAKQLYYYHWRRSGMSVFYGGRARRRIRLKASGLLRAGDARPPARMTNARSRSA